ERPPSSSAVRKKRTAGDERRKPNDEGRVLFSGWSPESEPPSATGRPATDDRPPSATGPPTTDDRPPKEGNLTCEISNGASSASEAAGTTRTASLPRSGAPSSFVFRPSSTSRRPSPVVRGRSPA